MYCKHCRKEIDDNSKFCKECGGEIQPIEQKPIDYRKTKIKVAYIAIAVLVSIILLVLLIIPQSNINATADSDDPTEAQNTNAPSISPTIQPSPTSHVIMSEPICSRIETIPWGESKNYVTRNMKAEVYKDSTDHNAIWYNDIEFCGASGDLLLDFGSNDKLYYVGYGSENPGMFWYFYGYLETKLGKPTRSNDNSRLWINTALGVHIFLTEEINENAGVLTYMYIGISGHDYWFLHELQD